ncbi:MAG: heme ABC transporter substrate-binding protein IsdE [Clostridia bacterium]|nr:heme ABC transporter substrate-binding protein IsdE [Clostridia bacterium]
MNNAKNTFQKAAALVLSALLLLPILTGCEATKRASSDSGDLTPIPASGRVIGTSIATDEILDALGYDNVVGVPHSDSFAVPERYQNAKEVGSPMQPDMEVVKSLSPDIVFTPKSLEGQLKQQYDNIGLRSYFLDLESPDGMYASIKDMGTILGKQAEADKLCSDYAAYKAELAKKHENGKKPRVLILMGIPGSFLVATESSYVGSLAKLAGCENVYGDGDGKDFLEINTEDMMKTDPDIILRTSHAMPEKVKKMFAEEFATNDIWKHFRAVEDGRVYDLDNTMFGMSARFNYREAIADLEKIVYAE